MFGIVYVFNYSIVTEVGPNASIQFMDRVYSSRKGRLNVKKDFGTDVSGDASEMPSVRDSQIREQG